MLFIIALIIAAAFVLLCGKPLKKYPFIFYGAAIAITIASSILGQIHFSSQFLNNYIIGLFTRGAFPTALWAVVMWAGAMPNGSAPIKKIMPIRGELSIFAAIMTLGHNIGYGKLYFARLLTNPGKMSYNQIAASILTIIMLIIMIPLTVMSFKSIRKRINAKTWKKIQRTAYIFYCLIYIHVMILTYPLAKAGRNGYFLSVMVYTVVFVGYGICRIRKWLITKEKIKSTISVNIISVIVFSALLIVAAFFAKAENSKSNIKSTAAPQITTAADITNISETLTFTTTSTDYKKNTSTKTSTTNTSAITSTSNSEQTAKSTSIVIEEQKTEGQPEKTVENATVADNETQTVTEDPGETSTSDNSSNTYEKAPTMSVGEVKATKEAVKTTVAQNIPATPPPTEAPTAPPEEPQYIYNNGTYSGSAFGYDGNVYVTITIYNDTITSISGSTEESDDWYFNSASGYVMGQIQSSNSPYVDAFSGATYSSNAIMNAVNSALNSARK